MQSSALDIRPAFAAVVPRLVRTWSGSWMVTRHGQHRLHNLLADGPVVLAFWHEDLAVLGPLHADRNFVGMVSRSADGERLAHVLEGLGYRTIRGSTSNFARSVARAGLRALRDGLSVAVAIDGPRGPRRTVAPGAQTLARWAGVPLVLVGCRAWPAVRLGSWDRQRIPAPFARVEVAYRVADVHVDPSRALEELGCGLGR